MRAWNEKEVLELLRSISGLKIAAGNLNVTFEDGETCVINEFEYESLTRDILAAIEHHMLPPEDRC